MRPPAEILDRLNAFRLIAGGPHGLSRRQGERRSSSRGVGMEFAGNRPYREGDDLRQLDTRLFARYRQPFIREHFADRQLRVAILVDASASMAFGRPSKRDAATMLAGMLGCAALSAGDLVEVGMARGGVIEWSDALQGSSRSERLLRWLDEAREVGIIALDRQIGLAQPRLRAANLAIIISDWWLAAPEHDLAPLHGLDGILCGVQVLAPEEHDPLLLGRGAVRLRDSESQREMDVVINAQLAAAYRELLARHNETLAEVLERHGGRLLPLRTDMPASEMFAQLVHERLLGQIGVVRAA